MERFAQAQRDSLQVFETETEPGVRRGQRIVPVDCAGCCVPGGRYAHAASAIMEADIIVGPGNAYVAEAKRPLFGRVGVDVFAGPTESAIIAMEGHARACDWRLRKYAGDEGYEVYDQRHYE